MAFGDLVIHDEAQGPPVVPELDRAIATGINPHRIYSAAASLGAKQGAIYHRNVYGRLSWEGEFKKTTFESVFDISSLTKPLATGLAAMQLVAKGRLALDAPVSRFLKDFQGPVWDKILLENLLDHTSGLISHAPYWDTLRKEQETNPALKLLGTRAGEARIRELVMKTQPQKPPNEISLYSDLNFMILGWVIESVVGKRLDVFVMNEIYRPLDLKDLFFVDMTDPKRPYAKRNFVATEHSKWRFKTLQGEVHDPNAWAMGGVAGHAGLFATLDGVYSLAQMLLDSYLAKPGAPFHTGTVRRFFTRSKRTCNKTWALGWDTPSPRESLAGSRMSRVAVGHFGFTGCSLWLDLQRECVTVFLTNRAHPTPDGKDEFMRKLRPHLEDLHSAYAQSWTPPPVEEEEDPYKLAREMNEKKKKAAAAGGSAQPPAGSPGAPAKKA